MSKQRSRRAFLSALGAGATAGLAGCTGVFGSGGGGGSEATVLHAGSLAAPWEEMEAAFEESHDATVNREAKGSVDSTRKITEEPHRAAEALGVSDFRLIRDMVLPDYGSWYAIFATNAMTVAYTDQSKYADEFGTDTWYDVLSRDDVNVAHSDPAADPNGYRSVMSMRLGAETFEGSRLYDEATAQAMEDNAVVGTGTESALIGQLQSGELDYAWEYQSAGASHDVQVVDLQPEVDLSKATSAYAEHYAKVTVEAGGNSYTGAPIAYGITVPNTAENPDLGAEWVNFVTGEEGRSIMRDNGFEPVSPAMAPQSGWSDVPESVKQHATAQSALGPLTL
ncbi:MAG: extracellular solute-binding protein [Halobacteriaceae archaeon]